MTTKIFCRPSCPSRLARRANICFYDTVEDASNAGYRPCRRCKPDQATPSHLANRAARKQAVDEACRYMEQASTHVKFSDVAKHVNLSTRYFHGLFKEVMGITPAKYVELYKTCQVLDSESSASPASVETASHAVIDTGFQSFVPPIPVYTANLDFASYGSGPIGKIDNQALHTSTYSYNDHSTASTDVVDSSFPPNEFDLFLNEPLEDIWAQSSHYRV